MMKYNSNYIFILLFSLLIFDTYADEPKVCFFIDDNYNGESLCAGQGNSIPDIPEKWNDRISSISIPQGLVVSVYENINYLGKSLTFSEDVDLVTDKKFIYFNDIISSFKIKEAVCFYGESKFTGDSVCLSNGEELDLYNNNDSEIKQLHLKSSLNDKVYSIKIPYKMQTTIYEDDSYNGSYFTLIEDYHSDDLLAIGMHANISSLRVFHNDNFICDRYCPIKNAIYLNIQNVFGEYWSDPRIEYKDVLVGFILSGADDFFIKFSDSTLVRVKDNKFILIDGKLGYDEGFSFDLNQTTGHLSFLLRFYDDFFQIQFIESSNNKAIYYSPLFGVLSNFDQVNVRFGIVNNNSPLIIDKMVLAVGRGHHRVERGTLGLSACWLIPLLSIYNYVVQGKCNQVDKFVHNATDFFSGATDRILQIFGSSLPLAKKNDNEIIDENFELLNFMSDIRGYLTFISLNTDKNGLTLPATALACKKPIPGVILPHMRHQRDLVPGCIDWTLDILTDFTLLFGGSTLYWNSESFGRVIDNILRDGTTGIAVADVDTEVRLIEKVQAHTSQTTAIADMVHLKTAFDFSQLNYAAYLRHHDEGAARVPQAAQELPLGRYELALGGYQFVETVPRIRQNARWVYLHDQRFDIEIISGPPEETAINRQGLLPTIEEWRRIYRQQQLLLQSSIIPEEVTAVQNEMVSVVEAARLTGEVASSWLENTRDDYVYVIVRFAGQVVSITLAVDINEHDVGIAGSLTNPQYVLTSNAEGSVRGAGTAAIRALADHYKRKGKISLVSSVISQPSAIVKKKVGFQFAGDL